MKVSVVYAGSHHHAWVDVDVASEATVEDAIQRCGLLEKLPEIDTETMKIGIFGKFTTPKQQLREGDRVEIYRRITRVLDEDDDDD